MPLITATKKQALQDTYLHRDLELQQQFCEIIKELLRFPTLLTSSSQLKSVNHNLLTRNTLKISLWHPKYKYYDLKACGNPSVEKHKPKPLVK